MAQVKSQKSIANFLAGLSEKLRGCFCIDETALTFCSAVKVNCSLDNIISLLHHQMETKILSGDNRLIFSLESRQLPRREIYTHLYLMRIRDK